MPAVQNFSSRRYFSSAIFAALVWTGGLLAGCTQEPASAPAPTDSEAHLGRKLAKRIEAWHEGAADNGERLKLIYFHPAKTPPKDQYSGRLSRIMIDIGEFLHSEMRGRHRFGGEMRFEVSESESESKNLLFHTVEGQHPGPAYQYPSSGEIRAELTAALTDKVDFANDFVLVISGLSRKREDGSYFFHAPYYGDGSSNQERGLCWAADCELQDITLLTREADGEEFRYEEHSGTFKRSLAEFNALYIGGIAHELGHGLSLPHNGESQAQRSKLGTALMGSGNFTYRQERFTDKKGSFLTLASALRLAVHPLFTHSDRGRDRDPSDTTQIVDLKFSTEGRDMIIDGKVEFDAKLPPLAVIAYKDPPGNDGYNAKTSVAEIDVKSGAFQVRSINHAPNAAHELRLAFVHPNGATINLLTAPYQCDKEGRADVSQIETTWVIDTVEQLLHVGKKDEAKALAEPRIAASDDSTLSETLRHLLAVDTAPLRDDELIDLTSAELTADKVALSTADWKIAEVGWGKPGRDYYDHSPEHSFRPILLRPGGTIHTKGLYAHAPSRYEFDLGGKWKTFTATAGLQKQVTPRGQARFIVLGDGRELFRSEILKTTATSEIEVDVSGVKVLSLTVESGKDNNFNCWSVWGSPTLSR